MAAAQTHNPADYAICHWEPGETNAEHAERVEKAEVYADSLFEKAHSAIIARRDEALAGVLLGNAPSDIRVRAMIRREAATQIQLAENLTTLTADHHMRTGDDVSDELDRQWTRLIDPARAEVLWPTQRVVRVGDHDAEAA